jgi:F-type H+-transporting ATPase subunit a
LGLIPIFDFLGLINYLAGGIPVVKDLIHGGNTVTANINLNFALATITFGAFTIAGIKRYGFFHHWKNLAPPGLAWPLYFIVVPIEVMAMLIRPISLTLRLAGNMMGGHLALIIFTQLFIIEVAKNYGIFAALGGSIFSVSLSIGVIFLEIIVAFIQAYVFALLTAVYIGMAVNVDH